MAEEVETGEAGEAGSEAPKAPKGHGPDRRRRVEVAMAIRRLDPTLGGADLARKIEAHGLSDELLAEVSRFLLGVERNRASALTRAKRFSGHLR
jgi:hypothetical protein